MKEMRMENKLLKQYVHCLTRILSVTLLSNEMLRLSEEIGNYQIDSKYRLIKLYNYEYSACVIILL